MGKVLEVVVLCKGSLSSVKLYLDDCTVKAIQLEYLLILVKVTRNRGRDATWDCPLGAVRVAVICLALMTLKSKYSRLVEISSAGKYWGRLQITDFIGLSEFGKKVK
jgi:hypothetical protein